MPRANCVICALSTAWAEGVQMGAMPVGLDDFFALGFAFDFSFAFPLAFSMATLSPTPDARQPGLLLARQAGRPVVVFEFGESRRGEVAAPGFQVVVDAVAPLVPALLVRAARIGTEQHPARL